MTGVAYYPEQVAEARRLSRAGEPEALAGLLVEIDGLNGGH
ncbi:hypothetical protein [Streptomyces sp. NPDC058394]